jgi:hypothetical protein
VWWDGEAGADSSHERLFALKNYALNIATILAAWQTRRLQPRENNQQLMTPPQVHPKDVRYR